MFRLEWPGIVGPMYVKSLSTYHCCSLGRCCSSPCYCSPHSCSHHHSFGHSQNLQGQCVPPKTITLYLWLISSPFYIFNQCFWLKAILGASYTNNLSGPYWLYGYKNISLKNHILQLIRFYTLPPQYFLINYYATPEYQPKHIHPKEKCKIWNKDWKYLHLPQYKTFSKAVVQCA